MWTALDDVSESFPLLSVELAREDHVCDGVHHLLLVGLPSERVLSIFRLNLNLLVATPLSLALTHQHTCTLPSTLPPTLTHALRCLERTQRLFFFPICLIVSISWLFVGGRTRLWIRMV